MSLKPLGLTPLVNKQTHAFSAVGEQPPHPILIVFQNVTYHRVRWLISIQYLASVAGLKTINQTSILIKIK